MRPAGPPSTRARRVLRLRAGLPNQVLPSRLRMEQAGSVSPTPAGYGGVPPPRLPGGRPWLPPRPQLLLPGPDYHGTPQQLAKQRSRLRRLLLRLSFFSRGLPGLWGAPAEWCWVSPGPSAPAAAAPGCGSTAGPDSSPASAPPPWAPLGRCHPRLPGLRRRRAGAVCELTLGIRSELGA